MTSPALRALPREATAWIGGKAQPGERWFEVTDPYRGELAARVAISDERTVDEAVRAAAAAQPVIAAMPAHERAAVLRRAADLLDRRAEELAQVITRQTGKVLRDTIRETRRVPWTLRAAATAAESLEGHVYRSDALPLGQGVTALSVRQPVGVVAAITPFNAPLNLVAHKVAPAIAAGNAIVVKPASPAPLTAFDLAWALEEAGLPPGVVNVVPGNAGTGTALLQHADVALITFTGSPEVGAQIRREAGFKRLLMELGGNSPNLVHVDANLSEAVDACLRGGFSNGGQSCNSVQRILVHREVREEFSKMLVSAVEALRVGDPLDPATDVGPVIDERAAERVVSWIDAAVDAGATVLTGGAREGALIRPTVVADAPSACQLYSDEIFAPVVVLSSYDTLDEAITMANGTSYGLQAAVFTSSLDVAFEAGLRIRAGGVMVNRSSNFRLDHLPYGGMGSSGLGREGPMAAVEEMTELKLLVMAPSTPPQG